VGIDLHTAAIHRINLPQIRCVFRKRPRVQELGRAFGTPVMLESPERPGSLREAARAAGVDVLSYEGGEGLRFDEFAIRAGVDGITGVMLQMDMLDTAEGAEPQAAADRMTPVLINASSWLRSPEGGVFRTTKRIGDGVSVGETVGHVANPYEDVAVEVRSPRRGIIIGRTTLPIVNMGDALLNIGWSEEFPERVSPERELPDDPPDDGEMVD
jgi:predicted deacylase